MRQVPALVARRSFWLLPLSVWGLIVAVALHLHLGDLRRQSLEVATEGAREIFRMIVLARAWNAEHGGVYVPVSPKVQPNPYLEHPRRDVTTTDGRQLTLVNPAFMTRLMAEMARANGAPAFHITSVKPIRPGNVPDDWERRMLEGFERGVRESVEVVRGGDNAPQLRYMAPLYVQQACMTCHEKQGYKVGDIRGGISVSFPFAAVEAASEPGRRQAWLTYGGVFLLVALLGALLLETLRRRWMALEHSIDALETARGDLESANRLLASARDAAEAANRAKTAFLANMSHELRTPMNAIVGFTHMLRMGEVGGKQAEMLGHIDTASQNLLTMIDEVLDLARLEAGDFPVQMADFDLDTLLAEQMTALRSGCVGKGLHSRLDRDADLPAALRGDRQRIAQLLSHFLQNATKFSESGEIVLRAIRAGQQNGKTLVRFEVEDQGIGISREEQARLFRVFEQIDMSSTRRHGGAGIGLAICKRLAELMQGTVGVVSAPGMGSRFWFELALDQAIGAVGKAPAEAPVPTSPDMATAASTEKTTDLLGRLIALLAEADIEAVAFWQHHRESLWRALGERATVLDSDIRAYRFEHALATLRDMAKK